MTDVPRLTSDQMREVDRAMIEDYGIDLARMMENAGSNLARLARSRFLGGDPRGKTAVVLCGAGGNGGGGLVCARHLNNWGATVVVLTTVAPEQFVGVPALQLEILVRMNVAAEILGSLHGLPPSDLLVDAVIGYSLSGAPRGRAADLIRLCNRHGSPVLRLDTPSGLDATTGAVHEPAVRATATMTLALPKKGLFGGTAGAAVGELYLADIGVPPELYSRMGLSVGPLFARESIVRIS